MNNFGSALRLIFINNTTTIHYSLFIIHYSLFIIQIMRIISGNYRGKKLYNLKDEDIRPTLDRVKEDIFNILMFKVNGCAALDLFAGTGALGLECISRGAKTVIFNDNNKKSIEVINKNLNSLPNLSPLASFEVICSDYLTCLKNLQNRGLKFDIIFLDPPFDTGFGVKAVKEIKRDNLLNKDGIIVFEHGNNINLEGIEVFKKKRYAYVTVSFTGG